MSSAAPRVLCTPVQLSPASGCDRPVVTMIWRCVTQYRASESCYYVIRESSKVMEVLTALDGAEIKTFMERRTGSLQQSGILSVLWHSKVLPSLPAAKQELTNPNVIQACAVRVTRSWYVEFCLECLGLHQSMPGSRAPFNHKAFKSRISISCKN